MIKVGDVVILEEVKRSDGLRRFVCGDVSIEFDFKVGRENLAAVSVPAGLLTCQSV